MGLFRKTEASRCLLCSSQFAYCKEISKVVFREHGELVEVYDLVVGGRSCARMGAQTALAGGNDMDFLVVVFVRPRDWRW